MSPASLRPPRGWGCHRSTGAAGAAGEPHPRQRGPSWLWGGLGAGDHRQCWDSGLGPGVSWGATAREYDTRGGGGTGDGKSLGNPKRRRGQSLCCSLGSHQSCLSLSALTDGVPTTCCFSYQQRPVPRSLIASIYITSSSCSQPGVM